VLFNDSAATNLFDPPSSFQKSSLGDESMSNWAIGYDIIDKAKKSRHTIAS